ncbi:transcription factor E2F7 [Callorhinchus milii]|nr:transcription factor E2F7 [Callorhinchus milii]
MECLKLKDLSARKNRSDFPPDVLKDESKIAQKENMFMEPSRTLPRTPVKAELTPTAVSKRKACTPDHIQMTPNKHMDKSQSDPWTPTANLKMLISAASPDIRDREKKKELFRQIENERVESISDVIQFGVVGDGTADEFEPQRPSRKQKSLGLLCQKFLARYPDYPTSTEKTEISLDEVATELRVERRRIYDIVNVLESLHLVSRMAKNQYSWHGLHNLSHTLAALKRRGEQHRYAEQMVCIRHKELDVEFDCEEPKRNGVHKAHAGSQEFSGRMKYAENDCRSVSLNSRKDKSLRIMSEKFVMLFLVSKTNIVALDIAAKILIEESQHDSADQSKFKTKIRRLYDIANVLTSLGLIKKVHVTEERGRKPAFKWLGPIHAHKSEGIQKIVTTPAALSRNSEDTALPLVHTKEKLARHASFPTLRAVQTEKIATQSAPCSPVNVRQVRTIRSEANYNKMAQLAAVCRLQFEEDKNSKPRPEVNTCQTQSVSSAPSLSHPIFMTSSKVAADSLMKPLFQPEVTLPVCLPDGTNGQLTVVPQSVASTANKAHFCFLENQPFLFVQNLSSAPVFMLYENGDPTARTSTAGSGGIEASLKGEALPTRPEEASPVCSDPSRKRSAAEFCRKILVCSEESEPAAKQAKMICFTQSSGERYSEVPVSTLIKGHSTQQNGSQGNRIEIQCSKNSSETNALPSSQALNPDTELNSATTYQCGEGNAGQQLAGTLCFVEEADNKSEAVSPAVQAVREDNQEYPIRSGRRVPRDCPPRSAVSEHSESAQGKNDETLPFTQYLNLSSASGSRPSGHSASVNPDNRCWQVIQQQRAALSSPMLSPPVLTGASQPETLDTE